MNSRDAVVVLFSIVAMVVLLIVGSRGGLPKAASDPTLDGAVSVACTPLAVRDSSGAVEAGSDFPTIEADPGAIRELSPGCLLGITRNGETTPVWVLCLGDLSAACSRLTPGMPVALAGRPASQRGDVWLGVSITLQAKSPWSPPGAWEKAFFAADGRTALAQSRERAQDGTPEKGRS
jgi:hypothetical protein